MKKISIGNKIVGTGEPCFISFEPGATYTDLSMAKKMIKAVASAGADGIKFQTFTPNDADRMMGRKDITVSFSTTSGKKEELVYDALKRRELPEESWRELAKYSRDLGISFITSPYFPETIDLLLDLQVDAIKVSKGDINNVILIDKMAKTNLPIILDAREKSEDVDNAIKICERNGNGNIIVMHCPSGYPAETSGVHLNAIRKLHEKYDYPIGFADHSPGSIMNYAAVALGTNMLEKTITLDKTTEKVEHFMSLELHELEPFVKDIRMLENAMGNPEILQVSRVEENARRSLVAKKVIKRGEIITLEHLDFQRPGNAGISCADGFKVIGKKILCDISAGVFLQWSMLE